jgi:hypothetical protein
MTYDVYQGTTDSGLRWRLGRAPGYQTMWSRKDWELVLAGTSQLIDDIDADVAGRGFCFFRLVSK